MRFSIPTVPHGQMRPKFSSRGKFHKAYKDPKQKQREDELKCFLQGHSPEKPFVGPVRMNVACFMPRPKAHYGSGSNVDKIKDNADFWHTKKPDVDNMLKMLKDCMTGIFYHDDRQVCDVRIMKVYSDDFPKWEIEILEMEDE